MNLLNYIYEFLPMDETIKLRMRESMNMMENVLSNNFIDWLGTQGTHLTPDLFRDALINAVDQRLAPPHNDPPLRIRNNLVIIENHLFQHRTDYAGLFNASPGSSIIEGN